MKNRESRIEDGGWQTRSVLECGGPPPLSQGATVSSGFQSSRGLAQSKTSRFLLLFCLLISTFCLPTMGQLYSINWFKVSDGGGTSTGSVYQVTGTIGQPDAGGPMTNGQYSLIGGFWSVITVVQMPGAPLLAITFNSQLPTVTVSWPVSATNYVLQQNSDLTTANWTPVGASVSTNGPTLSVTISPPAGNLFFRLNSP